MRFTLRQLEVYLATARSGNLTRAADSLQLSQSAASEALRTFEAQYGVQLFDRAGKRLQLNALGKTLRPKAEALLQEARELEQLLTGAGAQIGELTVGATLSIGNYSAIGLLAAFQQQWPQLRLRLRVANTTQIVEQILNFDLDIGMIEGEISHPDLDIQPWKEDELVLFSNCHHPAAGQILDDAQLGGLSWILREPGSGTRQTFDHAMRGILPALHIRLELQHTEAIKRAVEAGLGVGCLSAMTLTEAFARGTLRPIHAPHRDLRRKLYLIRHRQKFMTQTMQEWLQLCIAQGNEQPA